MELYARSLYKIDCFKHAWLKLLQQGSTLTRSIRYLFANHIREKELVTYNKFCLKINIKILSFWDKNQYI